MYLVVMIGTRYMQRDATTIYQALWACNLSILLAGIGCITGDSLLIRTMLVIVSVDQFLWYVDLTGYALKRKFYVGVAKYIIWPQTTNIRLLTTFHHVFFLPLCLWLIHPSAKYTTFDGSVYLFSCLLSFLFMLVGRISCPKQFVVTKT